MFWIGFIIGFALCLFCLFMVALASVYLSFDYKEKHGCIDEGII